MPWYRKQEIIITAFHQGAIVVMEELNASAFSERCLNAVLSGVDLEGKPAKQSAQSGKNTNNFFDRLFNF